MSITRRIQRRHVLFLVSALLIVSPLLSQQLVEYKAKEEAALDATDILYTLRAGDDSVEVPQSTLMQSSYFAALLLDKETTEISLPSDFFSEDVTLKIFIKILNIIKRDPHSKKQMLLQSVAEIQYSPTHLTKLYQIAQYCDLPALSAAVEPLIAALLIEQKNFPYFSKFPPAWQKKVTHAWVKNSYALSELVLNNSCATSNVYGSRKIWSPDSASLASVSLKQDINCFRLEIIVHRINPWKSELPHLVRLPDCGGQIQYTSLVDIQWSPCNSHIAVLITDDRSTLRVFLYNVLSGDLTYNFNDDTNDYRDNCYLAWSQDSKHLALITPEHPSRYVQTWWPLEKDAIRRGTYPFEESYTIVGNNLFIYKEGTLLQNFILPSPFSLKNVSPTRTYCLYGSQLFKLDPALFELSFSQCEELKNIGYKNSVINPESAFFQSLPKPWQECLRKEWEKRNAAAQAQQPVIPPAQKTACMCTIL
jgi:hypothetical protein